MPTKYDKTWTLFLDRDGVINKKFDNDYIKHWKEFSFLPGVIEAITNCSKKFGRIVIVTNQQGIGKGLMSEADLHLIHGNMLSAIEVEGGWIDAVYYCPDLAITNPICRKPNNGMALKAKEQFPEIDFNKSLMIGDALTDMTFGKSVNMETVFIGNELVPNADYQYASLVHWYQSTFE